MAVSIIKATHEHDVSILILDHEQNYWVLTAHSVSEFSFTQLYLSNIIYEICLLNENNTNLEELRNTLFFLLGGHEYADEHKQFLWKPVERVLQEIKNAERVLLEIEPVAGAHILLLAKAISLEHKGKQTLTLPHAGMWQI
ncbi:hypothetical protein [Beggiatoa leptomitoformis]|uniref:Uncharacterized protein n=1 Tax=Beggiatoa leptomitoformis TaxID=288004 RepID=A0A2N9YE08_9GAMM|nr:hypothetical protein [Beggiatoa leptomitoformis]ALG68904.2 hypothetical protein AL038_15870 [Beggiatoa leptomitoformis]AUI68721.2 hypothetical protein BLE401_08390 [Beggiatoa leptomitoformis]